jgi:transcriptional regulator with XRE-family HTH domain
MSTEIKRGRSGKQPKNIISIHVREARFALSPKVTQEDLAGRLAAKNVSLDRSAIARIELGRRYVLDFELVALARALRTTTAFLLGETNDRRLPRKS